MNPIRQCTNCGQKVIPTSDGSCPACSEVFREMIPDREKPVLPEDTHDYGGGDTCTRCGSTRQAIKAFGRWECPSSGREKSREESRPYFLCCRKCEEKIAFGSSSCSNCGAFVYAGIEPVLDRVMVLVIRAVAVVAIYAALSFLFPRTGHNLSEQARILISLGCVIFLIPAFSIYPEKARMFVRLDRGPIPSSHDMIYVELPRDLWEFSENEDHLEGVLLEGVWGEDRDKLENFLRRQH